MPYLQKENISEYHKILLTLLGYGKTYLIQQSKRPKKGQMAKPFHIWCQFHQRFKYEFLVGTLFWQLFLRTCN